MAIVLREISSNGTVTDHALDAMNNVQVAEGSTYSLIDSDTQMPVEGLSLKRNGDDLALELDGDTLANLEDFYDAGAQATYSDGSSAVATSAEGGGAAWQVGNVGTIGGAVGLVGAGMAVSGGGGVAIAAVADVVTSIITVSAVAGPFITTMGVEVTGEDGTLLAELTHDFSLGPVDVQIQDYTGAIIITVIDINGDAVDYFDEATISNLSLGTTAIRAMTVTDENGEASASVTPLTELAVRLAGVTEDNVVTVEDVATNDQVAELFGLTDILADVTTIVDDDFGDADGTSTDAAEVAAAEAEAYGAVLAVLSGAAASAEAEEAGSGSLDAVITTLLDDVEIVDDAVVLSEDASNLIVAGTEVIVEVVTEEAEALAEAAVTPEEIAAAEEAAAFLEIIEETVTVPDAIVETADTTPPTTTISEIGISDDSGAADFVTNVAEQTITATLSAALEDGDVLMGSVDGGETWEDITSSVNGTAISVEATLTAGSILVRVDDAAGNQGAVATQAYTLDTTAPTTTISAIDISADTGSSEADFITNTAAQTITATLSAELADGDTLWGSVDGGETFTDITSSVDGTAISWAATLSGSSSIQLRVDDAATNQGAVASQAYVLDTSLSIASVVVAESGGAVAVTFSEDTSGLTLDAQSFSLVVNGQDYGFNAISLNGAVATLTLAQNIYAVDTVGSLTSTATDVAGNAPAAVAATNSSVAVVEEISKAYNELTGTGDLTITQSAAAGNDILSVNIFEASDAGDSSDFNARAIHDLDVSQVGSAGNDAINATLDAQFVGGDILGIWNSTSSSWTFSTIYSSANAINQEGGAGNDALSVVMRATASEIEALVGSYFTLTESSLDVALTAGSGGTGAFAEVFGNDISQSGGAGADTLAVDIDATATGIATTGVSPLTGSASASIGDNDVLLDGGTGDDSLVVAMTADAQAGSNYAYAYVSYNTIDAQGGDGTDNLDIDLVADAENGGSPSAYAYAYVDNNDVYASGETVDINLAAAIAAYSGSAYVRYNSLTVEADSNVVVNLDADAVASYFAYASVYANEVGIQGGASTDNISLFLNANATLTDEAGLSNNYYGTAYVDYNSVTIEALGGDDTVAVQMGAYVDVRSATSYGYAYNYSNNVSVLGGTGVDSVDIDLIASYQGGPAESAYAYLYSNNISVSGETVDINLDANAVAGYYAYASVEYNEVGIYGDANADNIVLSMNADATLTNDSGNSANYEASAYDNYNTVTIDAAGGNDTIAVQMGANADAATGSYAYAYVSYNTLSVQGGDGTDNLDIDLVADAQATSEATAYVDYNDIYASGETIDVNLAAVAGAYSATAYVRYNSLSVQADSNVVVNLDADAVASYYAYASVYSNEVGINGGASADNIAVSMNANATLTNVAGSNNWSYGTAYVDYNMVTIDAAGGDDTVAIQMGAYMDAGSASSYAYAYNYDNDVSVLGGTGVDSVDIDLTASVLHAGSSESGWAYVYSNDIAVSGETVDINLAANAAAGSEATAYAYSNDVEASGGDAAVGIYAMAGGYDANAYAYSNDINIEGGANADQLVATVSANAVGGSTLANTASVSATANNNFVGLYGGGGADTMTVNLAAGAVAITTASPSGSGAAGVSSNVVFLEGGAGVDTINLNMNAGTIYNNIALVRGGEGADIVNFNIATPSSGNINGNYASFYYGAASHLGDQINGLDLGSGNTVQFNFYGGNTSSATDVFNGSNSSSGLNLSEGGFGSGTTLASAASGQNFFYLHNTSGSTSSFALYYDEDGFGTGVDEIAVATFDADVGLTHGDIRIAGSSVISAYAGSLSGESPSVLQIGASQNDLMSAYIHSSEAAVSNINLGQYAFGGNDTLTARLAVSSYGATISNNTVEQDGGSGNDSIKLTMDASGTSGSGAYIRGNEIDIFGGKGSDVIDVLATATVSSYGGDAVIGGSAYSGGNNVEIDGEEGNDYIGLLFIASATSNTTSSYYGADARVSGNNIDIYGGDGSDTIAAELIAFASGSTSSGSDVDARVVSNTLSVNGDAGNDELGALLQASAFYGSGSSSGSYSSVAADAGVSYNDIYISGGSGNDTISATLNALAFSGSAYGSYSSTDSGAYVYSNDINLYGDQGADAINLNIFAQAGAYTYTATTGSGALSTTGSGDPVISTNFASSAIASAAATRNVIHIGGGSDIDTIVVDINAAATGWAASVNLPFPPSSGPGFSSLVSLLHDSSFYFSTSGNYIGVSGGSGLDSIEVDIAGHAQGTRGASVFIAGQYIDIDLGSSSDFGSGGEGTYSSSSSSSSSSIAVSGTETASLNLNAVATAHSLSSITAMALVVGNNAQLYGASADDALSVGLTATATATSASSANAAAIVAHNQVRMNGLAGDDTLNLDINVSASASAFAETFATSFVANNYFSLDGGAGADTLAVSIDAGLVHDNVFRLAGGEGVDIISLSTANVESSVGNTYIFSYQGVEDFGDSINGFADVFGNDNNVVFSFDASAFSLSTGTLTNGQFDSGTTLATADSSYNFFYLNNTSGSTSSFALYYDEDGFGTGVDHQLVATFDADVGLAASNIYGGYEFEGGGPD